MPSRIIREGWLESEKIDQLDAYAERFFLRLCLRADDFGRYHANPMLLRSNLYPLRDDVKPQHVNKWLAECAAAGLLICYTVAGKAFLEIPKFEQRMRAAVSKFPAPADGCPTDDGQVPVECPTDDRPPLSEAEAEADHESETESEPVKPETARALLTPADVYAEYPRKVAKQDAIAAITKALKTRSYEFLIERTKAYAAAVKLWPAGEEQFVPHPATWYNRGSYDDDPATWERKSKTPGASNAHTPGIAEKLGYTY